MAGDLFAKDFRAILQLAQNFSKDGSDNSPMEKREINLKELSNRLTSLLHDEKLDSSILQVEHGGRQYNYSPVPWIRIFDPQHAPTAQNGFYVVLLFAADGSSVYLSLNQGTSEFRSNAMRPINDDDVLLNKAAAARTAINDWASEVSLVGPDFIDLRGSGAPVGSESRRRIRNYELANVYAYEYPVNSLPSDARFKNDLEELLVLLWALENADLTVSTKFLKQLPINTSLASKKSTNTKQGRQLSEKVRKLIEVTAEDRAEEYYVSLGWSVERVGAMRLGYDLRCKKDQQELHIEVKGTTGKGQEVILTPNEVKHCKEYDAMALVIVSRIIVAEDETISDRGDLQILDPWLIDETHLTPSEYSYRVK